MTLFDPDKHEGLVDARWDEGVARAAIDAIVADARAAFSEDGLWPIHPLDVSPERAAALKAIYNGAAGVIWALGRLQDAGFAALGRSYLPAVSSLLARHRVDALALTQAPVRGYPVGDAGIALLHWTLAPSEPVARELYSAIEANAAHPALGFAWGGAGSMRAALFMHERSGEARWARLYLRLFDALWDRWNYDDVRGCFLWSIDLYGARDDHLGALHGLPGIAACMLRGRALLSEDRCAELERRVLAAMTLTARREGEYANWPLVAGGAGVRASEPMRVQFCTGAPGVVSCLAQLPRAPETDELLCAAGALTWRAGPTAKLPSLCHGAPGSGYAFLKLYARTGDGLWLARARRFAMHAIMQAERGVAVHGQRKFSLWTGDLGLALYLCDCIREQSAFPTLDVF